MGRQAITTQKREMFLNEAQQFLDQMNEINPAFAPKLQNASDTLKQAEKCM